MLNLRKPEIPAVEFERELPSYLADGEKCYLRVSARASGAVNPAFMAALEENLTLAQIADRRIEKITDDAEHVRERKKVVKDAARRRVAALYDACVISWESNILDGDAPIEATRENFLALAEVRGAPEIARAIMDLEAECLKAGVAIQESDEETAKN